MQNIAALQGAIPDADYARLLAAGMDALLLQASPSAQLLPLTASKFGGIGYWPAALDYPRNQQGRPLQLLAQFNLADMPRLPLLPASGLLAFYINPWCSSWGSSFDAPCPSPDCRTVYFEDLTAPSLSPPDIENLFDIPKAQRSWKERLFGLRRSHPIAVEHQVDAQAITHYPLSPNRDQNRILRNCPTLEDEDLLEKVIDADDADMHLLSGYACFTQEDPRDEDPATHVQLLQISSPNPQINWGDAGIGHFFIHLNDLQAQRFERACLYWDCC